LTDQRPIKTSWLEGTGRHVYAEVAAQLSAGAGPAHSLPRGGHSGVSGLRARQGHTRAAPGLTAPASTASRVAHGRNVLTSSAGSELLATMKEVFYVVSIHIPIALTRQGLLQTGWGAVSSRLNLLSTTVRHAFQAGSQMLRFQKTAPPRQEEKHSF